MYHAYSYLLVCGGLLHGCVLLVYCLLVASELFDLIFSVVCLCMSTSFINDFYDVSWQLQPTCTRTHITIIFHPPSLSLSLSLSL